MLHAQLARLLCIHQLIHSIPSSTCYANAFVSPSHKPPSQLPRKITITSKSHESLSSFSRQQCTRTEIPHLNAGRRTSTLLSSNPNDDDDRNENDNTTPSSPQPQQPPPPPTPSLMMAALNTSPRRIFLSLLTTTSLALGANFLGITSRLLASLPPSTVESTGLDRLYPVSGYRRFRSAEGGYSLRIPNEWVADQAIEVAKATRRAGSLDYSMSRGGGGGGAQIPDAAFGPPGKFNSRGISSADTNVSVLLTPVSRSFNLLRTIGTPRDAAEYLLRTSIAPEGSGRVGTLLEACEEEKKVGTVYQFEYRVDREAKGLVPLRAMSVIAVSGGLEERDGVSGGVREARGRKLVTMTVVAPAEVWEGGDGEGGRRLRVVAESFQVLR